MSIAPAEIVRPRPRNLKKNVQVIRSALMMQALCEEKGLLVKNALMVTCINARVPDLSAAMNVSPVPA